MASVYISYALGSAALAYVTSSLYTYSSSTDEEKDNIDVMVSNMELSLEKNPSKPEDNDIPEDKMDVATEESINSVLEDLYFCYACKEKKTLDQFSKNQQKRKPQNMWKCKACTSSSKQ